MQEPEKYVDASITHDRIRRRRRLVRKMSQREFAEAAGMGLRTLKHWENEGIPGSCFQLAAVATALGCTMNDLMPQLTDDPMKPVEGD